MKKAIFLFAFTFVLGAFAANAQSCSSASAGKSCCAGKVAKAAAADPSIEKRQAEDGSIAYVRKEADAQGNVKFVSVQFDEAKNTFVNVAPKTMVASEQTTMTKKTASCSAAETKACAGGATQGKACCASKTASSCSDKKAEQ
jgi:hypothetical protein